jgi:hypothetical protein
VGESSAIFVLLNEVKQHWRTRMSSAYDKGKQVGQNNQHQQQATPQQIPNYIDRQNFNNGLRDGQKK